MKYNRAEIMKRAWELKRKLNNTFAEALTMSWKIAKAELRIRNEYDRFEEYDKVTFNIWAGYGKVRAYYTCSWKSKYANGKGKYIDLAA